MRKIYLLGTILLALWACDKQDSNIEKKPQINTEEELPNTSDTEPINLTEMDNGNRAMMQAFYWDVEPRGGWWDKISEKVADWKANGIDRIWLPPACKGASGGYSMGYDPSDYFDLGEYEQHGTTETRFGSKDELVSLITKAHQVGLEVVADIVIGHNDGGGKEWNPYRNKETYTLFDKNHGCASGKFTRNYNDFHPNLDEDHDEGADFYPEQDLCHKKSYVQDWLWHKDESVAKYYKNTIGFDGWRFDYVKSFGAWVVKDWLAAVGGFAVGELWDGNADVLKSWTDNSGASAFDFACFYTLEQALDGNNLKGLKNPRMLRTLNPNKAVTFAANHDTEKDSNQGNRIDTENKLLAYAYILTHSGYPTIFYSDYEKSEWKAKLQQLLLIHRSLAAGEERFYYASPTEFIDFRLGDTKSPGMILYLNNAKKSSTQTVDTPWKDRVIIDYTNHVIKRYKTNAAGKVTITVPAKSYTVWSIGK